MPDDRVEQRPEVRPLSFARRVLDVPAPGVRVEHRELEQVLGGVEVDEQVVDLVQDLLRPGVVPVDLVDDDDRRQAALERLAQHEPGLRQRPLGGVHEQQHAVHHRERPLDFAAEVGVARACRRC